MLLCVVVYWSRICGLSDKFFFCFCVSFLFVFGVKEFLFFFVDLFLFIFCEMFLEVDSFNIVLYMEDDICFF